MRRRQVLAALGTTAIAGCTAPSTSPDPLPGESDSAWAQYGRSAAHTASNSTVAIDNPTAQWRTRTNGPLSAPVVVGDTLFVAEGIPQSDADMPQGSVAAYDRHTGSRRWRTPFPVPPATGGFAGCPPIVHHGSVYVGDAGTHSFYALDARTGEIRWSLDLGGSVNEPAVAADRTICIPAGDFVLAVDEFGRERWRIARDGEQFGRTPAIYDGTVFTSSLSNQADSGTFYALDLRNGNVEWTVSPAAVFGMPAVRTGTIYTVTDRGLFALDSETGTIRWQAQTHTESASPVAVDDEWVYAVLDGQIRAFPRRAEQDHSWRVGSAEGLATPPIALQNRVVASTETTGAEQGEPVEVLGYQHESRDDRWRYTLHGNVPYPAAALDGTVYVASYETNQSGLLVALGDEA